MSGVASLEDCPVCGSPLEFSTFMNAYDSYRLVCPACGEYVIDGFVVETNMLHCQGTWWSSARTAALAHHIRTRRNIPYWAKTSHPLIYRELLDQFEKEEITLPNRLVQMDNAVRYLGEEETIKGAPPLETPTGLWALIGSAGEESLANLLMDMAAIGMLSADASKEQEFGGHTSVLNARLSLQGWTRYEAIKLGDTRSRDGFIAMQFGDARLDAFLRDVIQKGVKDALDLSVYRVDSPGRLEAGLIDNIMREAIEDAAFVLVELSHGNRGAYWEAGFAEGLGKPVIYLCEEAVWNDPARKPHFDVNHRTTIMWDEAKPDAFLAALVATIKNSLRIAGGQREKAG